MPAQSPKQDRSERVAIISAVKTPLGFFVLVVLVLEAVLGAIALQTAGQNQLVALYGMLAVVGALIAIVAFFAYSNPSALQRSEESVCSSAAQPLLDFSRRICGHWWEYIRPDEPFALSFVEIHPYAAAGTVKMKGTAYSKEGVPVALWESLASCINLSERKIFYYWKGWHPARPTEPYEGFGEISFHQSPAMIDSGVGFFSDTNLTNMQSTTRKSVEFRRAMEPEIQAVRHGANTAIAEMVRRKLA